MPNTKISGLTDGVTANDTDRFPIARSPFGSTDNRYVTSQYIRTYLLALASTFSANAAASTPPMLLSGTWFTGGDATTTKPTLLVEPAGTVSTGWSTAGTGFGVNAPSGFTGNLFDAQLNGVRQAAITGAGNFVLSSAIHTFTGATSYAFDTSVLFGGLSAATAFITMNVGVGVKLRSDFGFVWSSTTAGNGTTDLSLFRDAAGVLAQRNGVNAQNQRTYFTFTDLSNYERAAINTASGYAEFAAETAGTGADNLDVRLTPAGTGGVNFPGGTLLRTRAALTNGAAAASGTLLNAPSAGNPTKWIPIDDNGTTRYIPAW